MKNSTSLKINLKQWTYIIIVSIIKKSKNSYKSLKKDANFKKFTIEYVMTQRIKVKNAENHREITARGEPEDTKL